MKANAEASVSTKRMITLINNITDAILSVPTSTALSTPNSATLNLIDTNNDIDGDNISRGAELRDNHKKPIDALSS